MDGRGMDVTPRDQRPLKRGGEGETGHSCLQASREAPDRPAVYLQQQRGSGGCAGGNRSAGVGGQFLEVLHAGSWALRLGSTGSTFPSLGPSPRWTTASHPHPGQLSVQRKLRQQLS